MLQVVRQHLTLRTQQMYRFRCILTSKMFCCCIISPTTSLTPPSDFKPSQTSSSAAVYVFVCIGTPAETLCTVSTDVLPLRATGTCHSHTFLPLLTSSLLFLVSTCLPSCFFPPCPAPEPGVWTDCDIGCVGDGLAGVISEGERKKEKNRSASLYLTPSSLLQQLQD